MLKAPGIRIEAGRQDRRSAVAAGRPESKPVLLWAALGAVATGMVLIGWTRWVTGPDFHSVAPGPDQFGGAARTTALITQYALFAGALWVVWSFALRPLVRERRFGFDGMLVLAGTLATYYEPAASYLNTVHLYNATLTNFGSWAQYIPGWRGPNADMVVSPVFFTFAMYIWFVAGFVFLGCWILGRLQRRFPRASTLSLFLVLYVICMFLDFAFETLIIRAEVYQYAAVPSDFSLWFGQRVQFPLLSMFCGALVLTGLTALRWFRDAPSGRSFAERGVERLKLPRGGRTLLSTLAVIGCSHLILVGAWFAPFNLIVATHADGGARQPSYMRHGLCGESTDVACPSELVPIPSESSIKIPPDSPLLPPAFREDSKQPNG